MSTVELPPSLRERLLRRMEADRALERARLEGPEGLAIWAVGELDALCREEGLEPTLEALAARFRPAASGSTDGATLEASALAERLAEALRAGYEPGWEETVPRPGLDGPWVLARLERVCGITWSAPEPPELRLPAAVRGELAAALEAALGRAMEEALEPGGVGERLRKALATVEETRALGGLTARLDGAAADGRSRLELVVAQLARRCFRDEPPPGWARAGRTVTPAMREALRTRPVLAAGAEATATALTLIERHGRVRWLSDLESWDGDVSTPPADARPYRAADAYRVADWLAHPRFGNGRVVREEPARIVVRFADGEKVLAHRLRR